MHPDGWMGRLCRAQGKPDRLDERWAFIDEILPRVRRLQDACRADGIDLIHIRVKHLTRDCRVGQRSRVEDFLASSTRVALQRLTEGGLIGWITRPAA